MFINSQWNGTKEERKKKDLQKHVQNNEQNSNKTIHIDNNLKSKWIKCSNQKI